MIGMKEQLESLNGVTINFGESGMTIVNIILAFVMFGVALGIKPHTFKDVFKNIVSQTAPLKGGNCRSSASVDRTAADYIYYLSYSQPVDYPDDCVGYDFGSLLPGWKYI